MAAIFYSSSQPFRGPLPIKYFDKGIHFVEYGILGILWFRAIKTVEEEVRKALIIAFVIAFLYGISDEIHQYFVPERSCSFYDASANGLGAWFGIFIYKRTNKQYAVSSRQ